MKISLCSGCMEKVEQFPCPHCGFDPEKQPQPEYAMPFNHILHGRYLMGRVLGQGGFGITYVGWDLVLGAKVAVKEYYPSGQVTRNTMGLALNWYSGDRARELRQDGMNSFLREARKMVKVEHVPQVVRVRDTFAENETAYIVMDFIEGRTLMEVLKTNGILSWERAKEIFFPVIDAMEQVHQAGLVHRDLSPDNLMLQSEGRVRILDLGAAKDLNANTGVSSMQVVKGGFSPIEQYTQRGGSGPWTDVYAVAATMYFSLTGVLPPTAVDRLNEDTLSWEDPKLKALPANVVHALREAMELQPQKRTQTMGDFLQQLNSPASPKPEPIPVLPKPRLPKWALIPAVLAAGLLVFALTGRPKEEAPPEDTQVAETETTAPVTQTQAATEETAEPLPTELTPVAEPVKDAWASSTYSGDRATHDASNLLDDNPKTNWTEGVSGYGEGEYLHFEFWDSYYLEAICIRNGNRFDSNRYYDNARPERITLTFSDGTSESFTLKDIQSSQDLTLSEPVMTSSLRITIDSVYAGNRYQDTVISDISFTASEVTVKEN